MLLCNIYGSFSPRDILGTIGTNTPINYGALEPILPQQTVDRLEQDCIQIVRVRGGNKILATSAKTKLIKRKLISYSASQDKATTELIQVLDEEERRWAQTLYIEEYQSQLARSVIQVRWYNPLKSYIILFEMNISAFNMSRG